MAVRVLRIYLVPSKLLKRNWNRDMSKWNVNFNLLIRMCCSLLVWMDVLCGHVYWLISPFVVRCLMQLFLPSLLGWLFRCDAFNAFLIQMFPLISWEFFFVPAWICQIHHYTWVVGSSALITDLLERSSLPFDVREFLIAIGFLLTTGFHLFCRQPSLHLTSWQTFPVLDLSEFIFRLRTDAKICLHIDSLF